ncbi:MAG TPA: secretion system protein F, partial [Gammaproteobacteria bacterium]|nr:secretion system protein F [Gammaproteobacteria bacterium]
LQKNGCSFMLTAEEYWAGRIVFALLFGGIALMSPSEGATATLVMGVAAAVGFMLPQFWIIDYKRRRGEELVRNLPLYLEYLTMCVDAGLNFSGALKQAVDKGPHGAMRNEFRVILRDINSGYSRADALNRFDDRVEISDISTFVRAVVQADKLGSSLKDTLYAQAQQRLNERFQRAEKLAMEAPVKLIVPLVIFIFPLTFIILLFPIVMKFMADGAF